MDERDEKRKRYSTLRAKTGKMDEPVTGELNITRD